MGHLCKTTTSIYVVCLKRVLRNNQTSGKGDPGLLKKLKKKCFKDMGMFITFMPTFSDNFLSQFSKMHSVTQF